MNGGSCRHRLVLGMCVSAVLSLALTSGAQAHARFQMPPQYLAIKGGYGLSTPSEGDLDGAGGYLQGEYFWEPSPWVSPRAYTGLLLTFPKKSSVCDDEGVRCDVSAKIGFLGLKGRLTIPIPYIAPFLELGIGASVGAMRTRTLEIDERMSGLTYHVPLTLGLALGSDHEFELEFAYLIHPSEKQWDGAVAFGVTFRLDHPRSGAVNR